MRRLTRLFSITLFVILMSAAICHGADQKAAQELQQVLNTWAAGYNEKNADAIIKLFDEHALFQGGDKTVVDYGGVVSYYKGLTFASGTYSINVISAQPLSQNIIIGFANMTSTKADGTQKSSRVSLSIRNNAGQGAPRWQITHWHFMWL